MISSPLQIFLSILAVSVFGLASLKAGVLDRTGFFSATVIGYIVLIFGGVSWFIILASFLIFTSLSTRFRYNRKKAMGVAQDKGGARTWRNVVANGLTTSLSALGHGVASLIHGSATTPIFNALFLGAICTATADTLATEIGLLSSSEPRLITNLRRRVDRGVSGGVSLLGEAASLLGALSIGLITWISGFGGFSLLETLSLAFVSGFLGCNLDSLLGASVQSFYKCSTCGVMTERRCHCGKPNDLVRGFRMIDNNVVNFISTLFGALITALFYIKVF